MAGRKLNKADADKIADRMIRLSQAVHGTAYKNAFLDAADAIRTLSARRYPSDVEADRFSIDTAEETKQLRIECTKDDKVLSRLTLDGPEDIYSLAQQLLGHYDRFEGLIP